MWGGAPVGFSLVWLWCGGHAEVGRCLRSSGSEESLVTLNLCVMRQYNVGEGDRVSTSIRFDISYLQMCRLVLLTHNKCGRQGMECKTHPIRYKEERCWVYR